MAEFNRQGFGAVDAFFQTSSSTTSASRPAGETTSNSTTRSAAAITTTKPSTQNEAKEHFANDNREAPVSRQSRRREGVGVGASAHSITTIKQQNPGHRDQHSSSWTETAKNITRVGRKRFISNDEDDDDSHNANTYNKHGTARLTKNPMVHDDDNNNNDDEEEDLGRTTILDQKTSLSSGRSGSRFLVSSISPTRDEKLIKKKKETLISQSQTNNSVTDSSPQNLISHQEQKDNIIDNNNNEDRLTHTTTKRKRRRKIRSRQKNIYKDHRDDTQKPQHLILGCTKYQGRPLTEQTRTKLALLRPCPSQQVTSNLNEQPAE